MTITTPCYKALQYIISLKYSARLLSVMLFFTVLLWGKVSAQDSAYFYNGKTYGSEALYNPLYVILNGSYDVLQIDAGDRNITKLPYKFSSKEVFNNLADPFPAIRSYGWSNFMFDQVIPFNFKQGHGQWIPNYTLHLIGGGMTFARTAEWYRFHKTPFPVISSAITIAGYHLLNEIVESGYYTGHNVDPIADIFIFDLGGMVLFSAEKVKRFFSKTLNLTDWSLQPSFSLRNGRLQNNGQYFSMKWRIPTTKRWHLFTFFGLNGLFGLGYKINDTKMISLAAGLRAQTLEVLDGSTNRQTVNVVPNIGLFYDRNNSLLVSLLLSKAFRDAVILNIYPGVLKIGRFSPGAYLSYSRNGETNIGITTRWTPGIAWAH